MELMAVLPKLLADMVVGLEVLVLMMFLINLKTVLVLLVGLEALLVVVVVVVVSYLIPDFD